MCACFKFRKVFASIHWQTLLIWNQHENAFRIYRFWAISLCCELSEIIRPSVLPLTWPVLWGRLAFLKRWWVKCHSPAERLKKVFYELCPVTSGGLPPVKMYVKSVPWEKCAFLGERETERRTGTDKQIDRRQANRQRLRREGKRHRHTHKERKTIPRPPPPGWQWGRPQRPGRGGSWQPPWWSCRWPWPQQGCPCPWEASAHAVAGS